MDTRVAVPPRGAKARIIRAGIAQGLDNESIIRSVEQLYPGQNRKKVQTEISRYRKYLATKT